MNDDVKETMWVIVGYGLALLLPAIALVIDTYHPEWQTAYQAARKAEREQQRRAEVARNIPVMEKP